MILPKQMLNEMLDGMEKMLMPAMEETTKVIKIRGSAMLAKGDTEYQTPGGIMLPVQADKNYLYRKPVMVSVNHRRRMKAIINDAKDMDEVNDNLGKYLFKYGDKNKYINRKN